MTALASRAPVDLGDPRLVSLVARLAGPAIAGISAHSLQMLVNAMFVAGLGPAAVAAVTLAQSMTLVIAALGYGLGIGAASLVSRALGGGDGSAAARACVTALAVTLPAGVLSAAALLYDVDGVLALLGATPTVIETARGYAVLSVVGTAVMLVHIVGGFIARAEGRAGFSMAVMVGAFGLNILLDAVFILGLGWGLAGAGWATLIGQLAAAGAYAGYFARGGTRLPVKVSARSLDFPALGRIAAIGFPATATTILSALALVVFLRAAAESGEAAVAGLGIALRVVTVGMLPVLGLCTGAQAVFGFAAGAGDQARLRRTLGIVTAMALLYGLVWSGLAIVFARPLLAPFAPDAATLELAVFASNAFHAVFVPSAVTSVVLTLFQSVGAARRAAALSLAAQGYTLVPPVLILPDLWGFGGVIASRIVAELAACLIALALLALGRRDWAGHQAPQPVEALA